MLTQNANGLFNTPCAGSWIIPRMRKEASEVHAQMQRLYMAARELRKRETKADVARLLHVSDQVLNGWESRGISSKGLIEVAAALGVNHLWLRDGTGEMLGTGTIISGGSLEDVAELVSFYGRLDPKDREMVLRFVRSLLPKEQSAE